jgi:hypothetical protein
MNRRAFFTMIIGAVAGAVTGVAPKPTGIKFKRLKLPTFKTAEAFPPIHKQVQAKRFPLQIEGEITKIEKPKQMPEFYAYKTIGYSYPYYWDVLSVSPVVKQQAVQQEHCKVLSEMVFNPIGC